MPATATVKEANGATPTWSTITLARFCVADVHNPGTNYPTPIPSSGFRYSYWKTICLEFSGIGTKVENIRFYTDGEINWTLGTGGKLLIGKANSGDSGIEAGQYDQATGTEGTTGDYMGDSENGHAVYKGAGYSVVDASAYTVSAPLTVDSTEITADGKGKGIVLQMKVDTLSNGAVQGAQAAETLFFRYDEI